MNLSTRLLTIACLALVAGVTFPAVQSTATAQHASQSCGCGSQTCGGCLKGKLFPAKKPISFKSQRKIDHGVSLAAPAVSQATSDVLISQEYLPHAAAATCGCGSGKPDCGCRKSRPKLAIPKRVECPDCDCDFCELKVSKTKEKKKCFEVKQKEVCIPAVRLPWKKNCPPAKSKVRVVNVLSTRSYECPKCKYEWTVHEPEAPQTKEDASSTASSPATSSSDAEDNVVEEVDPVAPQAPKINEIPDVESLDLETVPEPPAGK